MADYNKATYNLKEDGGYDLYNKKGNNNLAISNKRLAL